MAALPIPQQHGKDPGSRAAQERGLCWTRPAGEQFLGDTWLHPS